MKTSFSPTVAALDTTSSNPCLETFFSAMLPRLKATSLTTLAIYTFILPSAHCVIGSWLIFACYLASPGPTLIVILCDESPPRSGHYEHPSRASTDHV